MSRDRRSQWLRAGLTIAALGWALLIVVAPSWAGRGPGVDRDARATVAALVRVVGAHVCHQRPERSFHLSGRPMPVCGRCTGLYLSGALGLLAVAISRRPRPRQPAQGASMPSWYPDRLDPRAGFLAVAALPTLLTWALEVAGVWNPGTPLRALAAMPLGLAAGWLIGRSLDD